jgi:hypothetical protein
MQVLIKEAPMKATAVVRLFIRESGAPLPGVEVALYAGDPMKKGVPMAKGMTDRRGKARLSLGMRESGGRGGASDFAVPGASRFSQASDLRLAVYDRQGQEVQTTRYPMHRASGAMRLSVPIAAMLAFKHRLVGRKQRPSQPDKETRLLATWRDRQAKEPGPGPGIDLCMAKLLLETLGGTSKPKTKLQKQAAEALKGRVPAAQLEPVRGLAKQAHKLLEKVELPPGLPCKPGSNPAEIAKLLMSPGGPLNTLTQALTESAPPPDQDLGAAQKGLPFTRPFSDWVKDCVAAFENGELTGDAKQQMEEYFPDGLELLQAPSINLIDVYDVGLSNYVRHSRPADKTLEIRQLDPVEGWLSATQPMGVPLEDESVLVLKEDPADGGNQILATDVVAGQKVRLLGSGFISAKATVRARFARWKETDENGRLIPEEEFIPVFGWDGTELELHGADSHEPGDTAENFLGDRIVFDWPETAREAGLYRLQIVIPNDSGLPAGAVQDPATCEVTFERQTDFTLTLWFAVLPALDARRVRVRATSVECVDETNPEAALVNLFDDVTYAATGQISRLIVDQANPENLALENSMSNSVEGNHWFWDDGDEWHPNLRVLPAGDDAFRFLRLDEIINLALLASEIEGETDRIVMRSLVIALIVVLLILLVAIAVAVVVILVALEVITAGLATPIIGIIAAIAGVLFGTLLTGAIAAVEAVFASMPAGDPLGIIMPVFSGNEIAHRLSPVRFHRVLWLQERPALPTASIPTTRTVQITDEEIRERYRCEATSLGGIYRFRLVVDVA